MSLRSDWESFRLLFRGYGDSMRASSLLGRAFALRDRGRLEEAFEVCGQALETARAASPGTNPASLSVLVIGALTVDEIASKLGRPLLALEPLTTALFQMQRFDPDTSARKSDLLVRYEQHMRQRLDELRSAG